MVMHARKIPRLDDGYYDRNQTHPFEENPSKSHLHFNNSRYIEKNKEKQRENARTNQRHQKPGSSTNSTGDRRGNSHSNHDRNHRDGRDRGQKERDHKAEQVRKSAVRICGDWSEHISSSGKRYYYDCKLEVSQWEKPKEWNDMLSTKVNRESREKHNSGTSHDGHKHSSARRHQEHNASKGTSAATALSRHHTERPATSQNSLHGNTTSSSSLSSSSYDKHKQSHGHSASGQRPGLSHQQKSWHGHEHQKNQSPQFSRRNKRTDTGFEGRRDGDVTPTSPVPGGSRTNSSTPRSVGGNGTHSADSSTKYRDVDYRLLGSNAVPDSQQSEDMDISPGSTPTEESMMERISFSALSPGSATTPTSSSGGMACSAATAGAIASLPQLIQQLNDKNQQKVDSQQITQQAMDTLQKLQRVALAQQQQKLQSQLLKLLQEQLVQQTVSKAAVSSAAIHTLQKLQQALLAQQQRRTQHLQVKESHGDPGASPPSPTESDGTPLGSPEYKPEDRENSLSERSPRSGDRKGSSPTPSHGSSQGASVGTSKLTAAHRGKGDSADLTTSLSNYYNERLLEHVSNWPGDVTERQANRYFDEAHAVGSLHCTQISADLKKARSLVRIAEIKSTLQEQRILFLRHSVRDLENMRIQNNFMSSEDT